MSIDTTVSASSRPEPADATLPERVRERIRTQEENAEILIGWAQLAIISVFAALYAIAPKAADSETGMFEPAPIAIAIYFVFTLVRLILAYRRFTPAWFLDLSIIIDMAMLMALIWSFHLQYDQEPPFYLKAPTLLYVFIFISLRALRFDPRFVLTAGLVAAVGWLMLVGYAVYSSPPDTITRNYIEYMTSNKILLGAEFDKVISILMVSLILTAALYRARRLLVLAVREGTAVQDLSRFFAPEIARTITESEQQLAAGEGEARDAAILIVDIRGFTQFANTLPAHDVIRLLSSYQARMIPVIRRHGGAIDKFLGDGIMASFGAVGPSPSYAADALRAVDEILRVADDWNRRRASQGFPTPLAVNAAVATGKVVFGPVGDQTRLEYTVIGGAVNLAAKLEKHNKRERARALTSGATYRLALEQGYRPPHRQPERPSRHLPEMDEPVDLVVLAA